MKFQKERTYTHGPPRSACEGAVILGFHCAKALFKHTMSGMMDLGKAVGVLEQSTGAGGLEAQASNNLV